MLHVKCWWAGNRKILMLAAWYVNICAIYSLYSFITVLPNKAFSKRWRDHSVFRTTVASGDNPPGGLLSAHALSGRKIFLSKAQVARVDGFMGVKPVDGLWWVIYTSPFKQQKGETFHKFSAKSQDFLTEEVEANWLKSRNWTLITAFWMRFFMATLQYNRCLFVRLNIVSIFCFKSSYPQPLLHKFWAQWVKDLPRWTLWNLTCL